MDTVAATLYYDGQGFIAADILCRPATQRPQACIPRPVSAGNTTTNASANT